MQALVTGMKVHSLHYYNLISEKYPKYENKVTNRLVSYKETECRKTPSHSDWL